MVFIQPMYIMMVWLVTIWAKKDLVLYVFESLLLEYLAAKIIQWKKTPIFVNKRKHNDE